MGNDQMLLLLVLLDLLDFKSSLKFQPSFSYRVNGVFPMNINGFSFEYYPIVTQVVRINGKDYATAYQPDFDYRIMEIYQPNLQSQMASLIHRVQHELKIKITFHKATKKEMPAPSSPKGAFDLKERPTLKTSDVARLLNVSHMTIVRWANDGTLPFQKSVKGHRRFKRSDVEKLIKGQALSPNPTITPSKSELIIGKA